VTVLIDLPFIPTEAKGSGSDVTLSMTRVDSVTFCALLQTTVKENKMMTNALITVNWKV
jgi:hypothetical protein